MSSNSDRQQTGSMIDGVLKYLSIVLRYRWMIVGITAASIVLVVSFSILSLLLPPEQSPMPNYYTATAQLLLNRGSSTSVSATVLSALGVSLPRSGTGPDYGSIALEVLRSRTFLDQVIEENDLIEHYAITDGVRADSRQTVLMYALYDYDTPTGILTISYDDIYPDVAAQVANSMANQLMQWFADRGGTDNLVAIQTMEQKLQEVEESISSLQAQISAFQTRYGVLRVEEIAETQSSLLSEFQAQRLELDLQIRNLQQLSRIANDPELLSLTAQRDNIDQLIRDIENGYTGGSERLPPRSQLPGLASQFTRLQMDLEIQGRIYEALSEQYEVAKLTADTEPVFSVLEMAEVPDEKSGPARSRLSIVVTFVGFVGSIVLALVVHSLRGILNDPNRRRVLAEEME